MCSDLSVGLSTNLGLLETDHHFFSGASAEGMTETGHIPKITEHLPVPRKKNKLQRAASASSGP